MDLPESLSFAAPDHVGVRVEILPDLFVEVETARRIQALLLVLVVLIAVWARGGHLLRRALTRRPILPASLAFVPPPPAPARPASELRFLEGFARARKRALEVLQYAITTAPPALRTRSVELSGDPAAPLDPGRFRLKVACAPADPTVSHGFLENLRVLLPHAAVIASDDEEGIVMIDSAAALVEVAEAAPAPEVTPAPPPPPAAPAQMVLTPLPAKPTSFPRASAVPAPDHGRLVPLFAAPTARITQEIVAEEPEGSEPE